MKPTHQINFRERSSRGESRGLRARGSFPLTDYQFRSSTKARSVSVLLPGKSSNIAELHSFRQLSNEFLGDEASRDYLKEGILFSVIVAVSAWPIISMIGALAWLVK